MGSSELFAEADVPRAADEEEDDDGDKDQVAHSVPI